MSAGDHLNPQQFFHGTFARLEPGDMLESGRPDNARVGKEGSHVYFTTNQAGAERYASHIAKRRSRDQWKPIPSQPHVYEVRPHGDVEPDPYGHAFGWTSGEESFRASKAEILREILPEQGSRG